MKNVGVNELEQEYMGDVWKLETAEEDEASDILTIIATDALKGDTGAQAILESIWEEKWEYIKEKLEDMGGSKWYVWWMDGVCKFMWEYLYDPEEDSIPEKEGKMRRKAREGELGYCDKCGNEGIIKRLPIGGGGAVFLDEKCWQDEMRWRKRRNAPLAEENRFDLMDWKQGKSYIGKGLKRKAQEYEREYVDEDERLLIIDEIVDLAMCGAVEPEYLAKKYSLDEIEVATEEAYKAYADAWGEDREMWERAVDVLDLAANLVEERTKMF